MTERRGRQPDNFRQGPVPTLLERLQSIIERTYRMKTGIVDVGRFVLGDEGYRRFYIPGRIVQKVLSSPAGAGSAPGARLLLRVGGEAGEGMRAAIYYPDALVRRLERRPPTTILDEENIDDFAAFVEELDHLLCVAEKLEQGRPFSLLELELHANVTKYLTSALFLGRAGGERQIGAGTRQWLRYHLFEKGEFADEDPEIRSRYRDAARYAGRFLGRLEGLSIGARLVTLRRFHSATHHEKLVLAA